MNAANSASITPRATCSPSGPTIMPTRVVGDIPLSETMCATPVRPKPAWAFHIKSLQVAKHLGTCARDGGVNAVVAGQRRPAALLNERALLVGTDFLQLNHVGCGPRGLLKLVDADRRERRYDGRTGASLYHLFRASAGDPAAPVKADDQGCDRAGRRALEKTRKRIPAKNCWHFHCCFPFVRRISEQAQRTPEWAPVDVVKLD